MATIIFKHFSSWFLLVSILGFTWKKKNIKELSYVQETSKEEMFNLLSFLLSSLISYDEKALLLNEKYIK